MKILLLSPCYVIIRRVLLKTLLNKEKTLINSIFSLFHNIFKSVLFQGLRSGFCGKGLATVCVKIGQF